MSHQGPVHGMPNTQLTHSGLASVSAPLLNSFRLDPLQNLVGRLDLAKGGLVRRSRHRGSAGSRPLGGRR
jgi:hypothetical protein